MKKILLRLLIVVFILAFIGGVGFLGYRFIQNRNTEVPGVSEKEAEKRSQEESKQARKEKQEFLIDIAKEIFYQESPGTSFSIAIYDLNNSEYFGLNDEESQHAASVSKLLTAAYIYDQAEKGKADLSKIVGAYNIETQIQYLINQSSSDSWEYLDKEFKPAQQNAFAKSIGLEATDVRIGKNKMSPKDVATLLKKIAAEELLNEINRNKLFGYMQKTESEDLFSPAFKAEDVSFYHKTGKYLGEGHDAAIVNHPENPFVLVVFTNNNTNTNLINRGAAMSKIATAVYEYFDDLN
jgi:beta-lactamase class A